MYNVKKSVSLNLDTESPETQSSDSDSKNNELCVGLGTDSSVRGCIPHIGPKSVGIRLV